MREQTTIHVTPEIAKSYQYCRGLAKVQARNFYYSFTMLPKEKKDAMCAVYAFMRNSDDISDDVTVSNRAETLDKWREALDLAFEGEYGDSHILPAFHHTVLTYDIPRVFFHTLIDGTVMDLDKTRYETFDELYKYCYCVASAVGFVCIHIWGFDSNTVFSNQAACQPPQLGPATGAYVPAEACGLAFQLTNILRDVKEDAERNRIYLPKEDLDRFGLADQDILACCRDSSTQNRFKKLMEFEVSRARCYYDSAVPLLGLLTPEGKATFAVMFRIYRGLLDRIESMNYDVYRERARLSSAAKISIVAQAWFGSRIPCGDRLLRL